MVQGDFIFVPGGREDLLSILSHFPSVSGVFVEGYWLCRLSAPT